MRFSILLASCALSTANGIRTRRLRNMHTRFEVRNHANQLQGESFASLGIVEADLDEMLRYLQDSGMSISPTASPVSPTDSPTAPIASIMPTAAPTTSPPVPSPTNAPESTPTVSPIATPAPQAPTMSPEPLPTSSPVTTPSPAPPVVMPIAPTEGPTFAPTPVAENRFQIITEKCGVTPLERSRDILSILSLISDPIDLVTPTSPHFMARDWLDNNDEAIICATASDRIEQRYRLALLYYGMEGAYWYNCAAAEDAGPESFCLEEDLRYIRRMTGSQTTDAMENTDSHRDLQGSQSEKRAVRWLNGVHECEWFGLDCGAGYTSEAGAAKDAHFPLVTIDLSSNNLQGPLYDELFGFPELQGYYLDGNLKIYGNIPEAVGNMGGLQFLDFDDNMLSGPLPNALFTLVNLVSLDLNSNQLTGTLSEEISALSHLEVLQLENNAFAGPLPTEDLIELEKLVALTLEGNLFTGTLEPLCEVRAERRQEYEIYLQFIFTECAGDDPLVECSCCTC